MKMNPTKYSLVFLITAMMFTTAFIVSQELEDKRQIDVSSIRGEIAYSLQADLTNFQLLSTASCKQIKSNNLGSRINQLSIQIQSLEKLRGYDDEELMQLKREFSILEIQDYTIIRKMQDRCETNEQIFLAFVKGKNCDECRELWPKLWQIESEREDTKIYIFDTDLELNAIETLRMLHEVEESDIPALFLNTERIDKNMTKEELEALLPAMQGPELIMEENPEETEE